MTYFIGYTDPFMSPVTGKLSSSLQLPSLGSPNYIFVGNSQGDAIPSPMLIDVRLDIIELRTILDKLVALKFILQSPDEVLPEAQALNQLTQGFLYNNDGGILSIAVPGSGSLSLQQDYVYVGNSSNIAIGVPKILIGNLPDLPDGQLWLGNSSSRPTPTTILPINNMANLSSTRIWRGNILGRPEESDALTQAETNISSALSDLADLFSIVSDIASTVQALSSAVDALETGLAAVGGFAAILLLQAQVLGLIGAVAGLSSRVSDLEDEVDTLQGQVATIQGQITDIYNQLSALNTRIDNLSASFIGDVQGSGLLSSPIDLELMLTLDQIKKAVNTVDLNNNKMINLISDNVEQLDALNAKFLWDLMHDNVEVVWQ